MSTKRGLGKGFDSLLPQGFDRGMLASENERIQKLFIDDVTPNPDQPRQNFDETSLNELASSIKRYGILQPLIVTPIRDGKYHIIAGERRWRAASIAGLKEVPVIVRTIKEQEQLEIGLIENVQREDLQPLEQAASIYRLHDQFNLTYAEIAERLGKAATTVNNIVRLLQLPEDSIVALQNGKISEGHARAILALKDRPDLQKALLASIVKNGWSVRQAEQFVTASKQGAKSATAAKARVRVTTSATDKLSTYLKSPVSLKQTARGGQLMIGYKNDDDLARIIKKLY